jgi:hypothetical protein
VRSDAARVQRAREADAAHVAPALARRRRRRSYEHFRALVERECKPDDRILVLGCGNSSMSEGASGARFSVQHAQHERPPAHPLTRTRAATLHAQRAQTCIACPA